MRALADEWRAALGEAVNPRADAAAWAIIDVLPAHPMLTGPGAIAATGRARAPVYDGIRQLEEAGVLVPLTASARNRVWEARGLLELLELLAGLEGGVAPGR